MNNSEDADVALHCQEEVIMAHSFILKNRYLITQVSIVTRYFHEKLLLSTISRSEYFKTKLTTSVGDLNKEVRVEECSSIILATYLIFVTGATGIPV